MSIPDSDKGEQSVFQRKGIGCPGDRPWLGEGAGDPGCAEPLVAALINQTNLYFARTISAIALPDLRLADANLSTLRTEIQNLDAIHIFQTMWQMGGTQKRVAVVSVTAALNEAGAEFEAERVEEALESLFGSENAYDAPSAAHPTDQDTELIAFRRQEYNILREELDRPGEIQDLRVVSEPVPEELAVWFGRVNLVEKLRESRVFYGFDRLVQNPAPLSEMPDSAMRQLFRMPPDRPDDRWLPGVKVYGEGLFMELREERVNEWLQKNQGWLEQRLDDQFLRRLGGIWETLPPNGAVSRSWAARYLLVHSLAHIVINQLVFECGYSTASLRERLFVSSDQTAPMAAFMIYTSAGDSEGTLGGLVRLGRAERLGPVLQRALSRASWCSADPICSEHLGGQGSKLANLAACHACILLPETSCETINQGLDRAMVVGTPNSPKSGFLSEFARDTQGLLANLRESC